MTIDQPRANSLLETARAVLRQTILPEVSPSKTLDVLMVLRALEIAGRAIDDSADGLEARQRERYAALIGSDDPGALAAQIRAGKWDTPDAGERLHAWLTEETRDRLARVNPRYLEILETEEQ